MIYANFLVVDSKQAKQNRYHTPRVSESSILTYLRNLSGFASLILPQAHYPTPHPERGRWAACCQRPSYHLYDPRLGLVIWLSSTAGSRLGRQDGNGKRILVFLGLALPTATVLPSHRMSGAGAGPGAGWCLVRCPPVDWPDGQWWFIQLGVSLLSYRIHPHIVSSP